MSDEDVATRAPESDAQETRDQEAEKISGIEGDSKPDQGATSLGEHCVTDRPTPAGETPTGKITKFNDVEAYVTKPADYPHSPSRLLLLLTGGTGIHSTNNQLQADKYAMEGFLVVMPDQFAGDAVSTTAYSDSDPSLLEQVKIGMASVAKSFTIDLWLARNTPEKVLPILNRVITSVKQEFADAVANGGGIYAAGYCFGARYVLLLGSELNQTLLEGAGQNEEGMAKQAPQIKVGAIAHGTQVTKEDMVGMVKPVTVVAVENDPLFPAEVLDHGKEALIARQQEIEAVTYPGVPHGFAVLGDYQDEKIVQAQKEAFHQMVEFLKAH